MIVADFLRKKFIMMHIMCAAHVWETVSMSDDERQSLWLKSITGYGLIMIIHIVKFVPRLICDDMSTTFKLLYLHSGFSNNLRRCSIAAICLFLSCRVLEGLWQLFANCHSAKSQLSCFRPVGTPCLTPRVSTAAL